MGLAQLLRLSSYICRDQSKDSMCIVSRVSRPALCMRQNRHYLLINQHSALAQRSNCRDQSKESMSILLQRECRTAPSAQKKHTIF